MNQEEYPDKITGETHIFIDEISRIVASYDEFIKEIKTENDRAAVILGAAKLDYLLYELLIRKLLPNTGSKDDLFDGDTPLSSFHAKIQLCYRLGLINETTTWAINLIRKIRNDFAHEVSGCMLDNEKYRNKVSELISKFRNEPAYKYIRSTFFQEDFGLSSAFRALLVTLVIFLEFGMNSVQTVTPLRYGDFGLSQQPTEIVEK